MANYNFVAKDTGTDCGAIAATGVAYSAIGAGVIGIWDVDNGKYLDGASDILGFMNTLYSDDQATTPVADIPMHYIYPNRFQVVQGRTSGSPLATSIFYGKDVTHLSYEIYVAGVKQTQTSVVSDPASATTDTTIKVVTKACPVGYAQVLDAANPEVSYRVGEVFDVTINGDGSGGVLSDTLGAAIVAAFDADDTTNPFTCGYTDGTNTLLFTAKDFGYSFDVITTSSNLTDVAPTVPLEGKGVAEKVQALEKKGLASLGYHNRIWIPGSTSNDLMSSGHSVNGYDLIQIKVRGENGNTYAHSMEGKMRGDSVINMWFDEAWTDGASTLDTRNPFGGTIAAGTGVSYQFQNGVGIVDPS